MIVYFLLECLFLICIPLSIVLSKKFLNPVSILNSLWLVIVFLSSLQLHNLNVASEQVYWMFFWGFLSFNLVYFLYSQVVVNVKRAKKDFMNTVIKYRLLYLLSLFSIILLSPFFLASVRLILSGGSMATIRSGLQQGTLLGHYQNPILNAINILIGNPVSLALSAIVAIDFWHGNRDKKLIFLCALSIFMKVIATGGRNSIFQFLIFFIIAYSFVNQKNKFALEFIKKYRKYLYIIIALLLFFVLRVTLSRQTEQSMAQTYYYYFSMEPYMFENWANIAETRNIFGYGLASLNGFFFPVFYILRNIFQIPFPDNFSTVYELIRLADSQWTIIAGGTSANAYVSLFWYLFVDGRILGVVLGMAIYSFISAKTFFKALLLKRSKDICIYSLIAFGLISSFGRLQFADLNYAMAIIYVNLLFKRVKNSNINAFYREKGVR